MPYSTVLDVLAAEYGRPADEVFAHIDSKPLALLHWRKCIAPR